MIEDLRLHAEVLSHDGHMLGTLSRFVFEKDSRRLTHIVVDTGVLRSGEALWKGGWGIAHDRIVPIGAVESATSDEVRLTMAADDFRDVSVDYADEYFVPVPDLAPGRPDESDLARIAMSIPGEPGPYAMEQVTVVPPHEAEINKDSPVWRLRPHQKLGEVERVVFDARTKRITALVVRRGFVFHRDVVLPIDRVVEVVGPGLVHVDIDDDALKALPEFEPED
jgi:sporulation protein YlmC with PRC-barrel domain